MSLTLAVAACGNDTAQDNASPSGTKPSATPQAPNPASTERVNGMKVALRVGDTTTQATLTDNATARAFATTLPVTVEMSDMLERELYGALPEPLPVAEKNRQTDYQAGQLVYWPPGPGLAVYYKHAGPPVPAPGMVVLGTIDGGLDAFTGHDGTAKVTIDRTG
ncbi:hypothetical protein IQ60_27860 [Streptomyces europaeiscabiei]|nr:hypothetical protein IQ60_27860 [Streptomyces europaeiscabiei]